MAAERIKQLREQKNLTQAELFSVSTDYLLGVDTTATVSVRGLTEEDIRLVHHVIEHLRACREGTAFP